MIINVELSNGNIIEVEDFQILNPNSCLLRVRGSKYSDYQIRNFIQIDELITSIDVRHTYEDESLNTSTLHKVMFELGGINLEIEDAHPKTKDGIVDVTRLVKEKVYSILLKVTDVQNRVSRLVEHVGFIENPTTLKLEEFKDYYINLSRTKLDEYLQFNPLETRIKGRERKSFTITKEKQKLLANEIIMSNLAEQTGETHKPSWNAKGEPLSDDWTVEQLLRLSFRITETVRPLVSAQQEIELKVNACESIDDIKKIELDYSRFDIRKRNDRPTQRGEREVSDEL